MKKGLSRREFLGGLAVTVAFPSVIEGLAGKTPVSKKENKIKLPVKLEHISELWKIPGEPTIGIEGWNKKGLWSFYYNTDNGEMIHGVFFNYQHIVFMRYDDKKRTLAELRADDVPWPEIHRLHAEGFSWNPGYQKVLSNGEIFSA